MGCVPFHIGLLLWESACCGIPQSKIKDFCQLPFTREPWVQCRYRAGQGSNDTLKAAVRIDSGGTPQLPPGGSYGRVRFLGNCAFLENVCVLAGQKWKKRGRLDASSLFLPF